jgi:hypothetical protein
LATLALAGVSVSACGGGETDPEDEQDASVEQDTTTGEDAGMDAGDEDPDTTPDPDTDEGDNDAMADTGGDDGGGGGSCASCVSDEFKDDTVRNCSDQADERPARCDEDPTQFTDWGPGSVITNLELTSDEASDCCFNIDGSDDGSVDNQLASVLGFLPTNIDASIGQNLADGEFVVLNEHAGLTDLGQSEDFNVNFHLGEFGSETASNYVQKADSSCSFDETNCDLESSSGEDFLVNPESFDEGTHPQAQVEPATITNAEVGAGPGNVLLNLSIPDVGSISLDIRGAKIEASVDEQASDLAGDGVVLTDGKLGGYVLMKDVLGLINNLFSECGCLNNPDQAIVGYDTSSDDPDLFPDECAKENPPEGECSLSCTDEVQSNTDSCGSGSDEICKQAGTLCGATSLLSTARDLDVDGDGQLDAVSIGAIFEAAGANIEGIADYVTVSDQSVSGGEVTVDRVFANQEGWVAIYDDNSLGSENLLGSAEVSAGFNEDVAVSIDSISSEQQVWAVLHGEDGSGSFEADTDPLAKHYSGMEGSISMMFTLMP